MSPLDTVVCLTDPRFVKTGFIQIPPSHTVQWWSPFHFLAFWLVKNTIETSDWLMNSDSLIRQPITDSTFVFKWNRRTRYADFSWSKGCGIQKGRMHKQRSIFYRCIINWLTTKKQLNWDESQKLLLFKAFNDYCYYEVQLLVFKAELI